MPLWVARIASASSCGQSVASTLRMQVQAAQSVWNRGRTRITTTVKNQTAYNNNNNHSHASTTLVLQHLGLLLKKCGWCNQRIVDAARVFYFCSSASICDTLAIGLEDGPLRRQTWPCDIRECQGSPLKCSIRSETRSMRKRRCHRVCPNTSAGARYTASS